MEQEKYLMWAKRNLPDSNPPIFAPVPPLTMKSYGDSWEEQAFAEDASGLLGGCVWPPRSYSCSFCRREFRSAQALGGHMNVHRRDRARLKQSSPINSSSTDHHQVVLSQNHALNPCTMSFDASNQYSSQVCTFLYDNPSPNPDFQDIIRVSSPTSEEKNKSTLSFFSPIVHKLDMNRVSPPIPSWSSFVSNKRDRHVLNSMENNEDNISSSEKEDCAAGNHLSVSLSLVVSQTKRKGLVEEKVVPCKRRRIEENHITLLSKLTEADRYSISDFDEELDLELRLGDAPKVK